MKYSITGAAGNISVPLVKALLKAGHDVKVIGRNKDHLGDLIQLGAEGAIGFLEDLAFLTQAFKGADAVFTMCPPDFATTNVRELYEHFGENYAEAIKRNGIKHVVNLSSIGAHLQSGAGPVSGLYRTEQALNSLSAVNIKHLRPAYFLTNMFSFADLIRTMGIMGSNFSLPPGRFPVAHPEDVAAVAANELISLDFSGHSVRYIGSDETGTDEIAEVLGKAIGKPDLKWLQFTGEQAIQGMEQAGMPASMAVEYAEMFSAWGSGKLAEDYWQHRPVLGNVKLEDFAKSFVERWHYNARAYVS